MKREVRVGTWRSLDLAGGEQTATELAVVDAPDDLRQAALGHGIYMAGIHDEQFVMETPAGFISKSWVS